MKAKGDIVEVAKDKIKVPALLVQWKRQLEGLTPRAISRLKELLESGDEQVALGAVREVLNRNMGKPKESRDVTVTVEGHVAHHQVLSGLAEAARQRAQMLGLVDAQSADNQAITVAYTEVVPDPVPDQPRSSVGISVGISRDDVDVSPGIVRGAGPDAVPALVTASPGGAPAAAASPPGGVGPPAPAPAHGHPVSIPEKKIGENDEEPELPPFLNRKAPK